MKRRPTGWKRWFTITVENLDMHDGDMDTWRAVLCTIGDDQVVACEWRSTAKAARRALEFKARAMAKTVWRCIALEAKP